MNLLDILILVPLLLGLVRGLYNGFINELTSLIALVAGIILAYIFYERVFIFLSNFIEDAGTGTMVLSFIAVFVLVVLAINLLGKLLTRIVGMLAMGLLNRIAGGAFGLIKAAVILIFFCLMLLPYLKTPELQEKPFLTESSLFPYLLEYTESASEYLPDLYSKVNELQEDFTPEP